MWTALTEQDVIDQMTETEVNMARLAMSADGIGSPLGNILVKVVAQVRDAIRAGGYVLDADTTLLPDGLHNDAIAIARWKLLCALPAQDDAQSKPRKAENDEALAKLKLIANQEYSVEPPAGQATGTRFGNWNSENKVLPRTHPVPRPISQFPSYPPGYGNPDGPPDLP